MPIQIINLSQVKISLTNSDSDFSFPPDYMTSPTWMLDQVSPQLLRTHLRYLSDDLLEGRAPGERGEKLAVGYVATHFQLAGLRPLPRNSNTSESPLTFESYLHEVPLLALVAAKEPLYIVHPTAGTLTLQPVTDYSSASDLNSTYP